MVIRQRLWIVSLISAGLVTSLPAPTTLQPDLILVRMDGEPSPILVKAMDLMEERQREEENRSKEISSRKEDKIESRKDDKPVEDIEISDDKIIKPFRRPIPRVPGQMAKRKNRIRGRVRRRRKYQPEQEIKDQEELTDVATVRPSRLRLARSRNLSLRTRRKIKPRDRGRNIIRQGKKDKEATTIKPEEAVTNSVKQIETISPTEIIRETVTMHSKEITTISSPERTMSSKEMTMLLSSEENTLKSKSSVSTEDITTMSSTEITEKSSLDTTTNPNIENHDEGSKTYEETMAGVQSAEETQTESSSQDITTTTMVLATTEPDNDTKRVQLEEINIVTDITDEEVPDADTEIALEKGITSLIKN